MPVSDPLFAALPARDSIRAHPEVVGKLCVRQAQGVAARTQLTSVDRGNRSRLSPTLSISPAPLYAGIWDSYSDRPVVARQEHNTPGGGLSCVYA
jgi:hypothetical protein